MTLKIYIRTFQQFYFSYLINFIDAIVYHHNCDAADDNDADDSCFIFTRFFLGGGGWGREAKFPLVFQEES